MRSRIIHVDGPVTLDFGNGVRIQVTPLARAPAAAGKGRPGRKPSPSTQKLIELLQADLQKGEPGTIQAYTAYLRSQDKTRSETAASQVARREFKRIFGTAKPKRTGRRGAAGRPANPHAALVRQKLEVDQANGGLREASHYVRWLVDQPGVKLGLKPARPIVYGELRAVKAR
jgi:hypothetical protein